MALDILVAVSHLYSPARLLNLIVVLAVLLIDINLFSFFKLSVGSFLLLVNLASSLRLPSVSSRYLGVFK